ncbi:MAG: EVE domain-containing protein [Candidatus Pacebacteria bacterium]|nr:EVE domain-containing protein [Candidatus Paceibacterota bacterium]
MVRYWLFKSEPDCFGLDDLKAKRKAPWDGVRNFQARNFLRDQVQLGDKVVFYHSSCAIPAAVGLAQVVRAGYPDHTAWDPESEHYDPKSTKKHPLWYMVDVAYVESFREPVSLKVLQTLPEMMRSPLTQRGNRLSVLPLTDNQYKAIVREARG